MIILCPKITKRVDENKTCFVIPKMVNFVQSRSIRIVLKRKKKKNNTKTKTKKQKKENKTKTCNNKLLVV